MILTNIGILKEYNIIPSPSSEASILAPKFLNCFLYRRNNLEKVDNYSKSSEFNPINVFCDPINTRYYDAEKVKNGQKAIQQRTSHGQYYCA